MNNAKTGEFFVCRNPGKGIYRNLTRTADWMLRNMFYLLVRKKEIAAAAVSKTAGNRSEKSVVASFDLTSFREGSSGRLAGVVYGRCLD